jgi:DNA-binding MarR family transcriptional regulator
VLLNLSEADGELRMRDLAERVLLSRSGLSRLVDRMAAKGLVRRRQDPDDRRGTRACLTDEGMTNLRNAAPVHLRGVEEHFASHLRDDEVAVVAAALTRVASGRPKRRDRR